jgi:hypothetical protein
VRYRKQRQMTMESSVTATVAMNHAPPEDFRGRSIDTRRSASRIRTPEPVAGTNAGRTTAGDSLL